MTTSTPTPILGTGPFGFGTASLGNLYQAISDEQSMQTLETAWSNGVRYFDTAPHYGLGLAERRLGDFLRTQPREQYLVSTKVGRLLRLRANAPRGARDLDNGFDVPADYERVFDPSAEGVQASLIESLERLGLQRVDIAFLHDPEVYDRTRGMAEGLPALIDLRRAGVIDRVGIGVNSVDVALEAVREHQIDVVMIAGRYTLLEQSAAHELLPLAGHRGVEVIAAAPFNSGLLASPELGATYDYGQVPAEVMRRAEQLRELTCHHGVELPAAALQFPRRHPAVASVVVGSGSPADVAQNAQRSRVPIPGDFWTAHEKWQRSLVQVRSDHP